MLTAVREGLNFLELNASAIWNLRGGFSFFFFFSSPWILFMVLLLRDHN